MSLHASSLTTENLPDTGSGEPISIPGGVEQAEVEVEGKAVRLSNLNKVFWPEGPYTKRDLLQYYADIAPFLLPHLLNRAMVMKRYPDGAYGEFFFQKRAPKTRPEWLPICEILHASQNLVDFPVIQNSAGLLWLVNLGCIDLNQWYARCDDVDRPDYLHFDLDPTPGAEFPQVREAALAVRDALKERNIPCYPKTSGSRGIHIYVPIVRGPLQKKVWTFAKQFAKELALHHPALLTAEYKVAARPPGHVLVDYNQNAWGRTLASVYSVRPRPGAPVSTPVTWGEVEKGISTEDFRMDNVPARVRRLGDLFAPMVPGADSQRVNLEELS